MATPLEEVKKIRVKDEVKDIINSNIKSVKDATVNLVTKYTNSPYTTNAGKITRFIAKFIPIDFVIKLLQAKINK